MTTSTPDSVASGGSSPRAGVDELFRDVAPIQSVEDLASPDVFDSDGELEEFLASVRSSRNGDLA